MTTQFFRLRSRRLLVAFLVSLPVLYIAAEGLPTNNRTETWLAEDLESQTAYREFKEQFGTEETIVLGVETGSENAPFDRAAIESLTLRAADVPGVKAAWSYDRFRRAMLRLGIDEPEAKRRLSGLVRSEEGDFEGIIVTLDEQGLGERERVVDDLRAVAAYMTGPDSISHVRVAGGPVVVSELNRLGSRSANQRYFRITVLICFVLLWRSVGSVKLSGMLVLVTIWPTLATLALIRACGGEMNFILSSLPVMVMVFTVAICVHLLHYYRDAIDTPNPIGSALSKASRPCGLAIFTTVVGLLSLFTSDLGPVRQFGVSAAAGALLALLSGLLFTPVMLTLFGASLKHRSEAEWLPNLSRAIIRHARPVAVVTGLVVLACATGLPNLRSRIDPLDFLPQGSPVLSDVREVERRLTSSSSIEAVIEFRDENLAFMERVDRVRAIEHTIASHPSVRKTISLGTYLPDRIEGGTYQVMQTLGRIRDAGREDNPFVAEGGRLFRISARVKNTGDGAVSKVARELKSELAAFEEPVTLTGVVPMLESAQRSIFLGFWESFGSALLIITTVMMISLRSVSLGLLAMVPNLTPIAIVFGLLGWFDVPIDIGIMMTGSIALGIAVDGTFHFLVRYRDSRRELPSGRAASLEALRHTGAPIFQATVITGLGMLALGLSPFTPTARFGLLMCLQLLAAIIGDLILLPALLAWRSGTVTGAETAAESADNPAKAA